MFKVNRKTNRMEKIPKESFSSLGFRERENLQEWIANYPSALGEDLLIIQKEFSGFPDTKERLDLLALDKKGNLVIIENKLDDTGRDVTWQALKYASYCSTLSKDDIKQIYQSFLDTNEPNSNSEDKLSEFFDGSEFDDIEINIGSGQRIFLIAANFRKEVTSTVLWLLNFNIRMQCLKVTSFSEGEDVYLNFEQIIPTKDAEDFMISMAKKQKEDAGIQNNQIEKRNFQRQFWNKLLQEMSASKSNLFSNISGSNAPWISASSGVRGVGFVFAVGKSFCRVELYIDRGKDSISENEKIFDFLKTKKEAIEQNFETEIFWERKESTRYRRLRIDLDGNVLDSDRWNDMIANMTLHMNNLEDAIHPHLNEMKKLVDGF